MFPYNEVRSVFEAARMGKRTERFSHEWAKGAAICLNANPGDVTEWMKLADKLEECGEILGTWIRWLFDDTNTIELPAGCEWSAQRHGDWWENGGTYSVGYTFRTSRYGNPGEITEHFWAGNGTSSRTVTKTEARTFLMQPTKKNHRADVPLTDILFDVRVFATRAWLEVGTPVEVSRVDAETGNAKLGMVKHVTKDVVPVPVERMCGASVESFEYLGRTINVDRKHVKFGI